MRGQGGLAPKPASGAVGPGKQLAQEMTIGRSPLGQASIGWQPTQGFCVWWCLIRVPSTAVEFEIDLLSVRQHLTPRIPPSPIPPPYTSVRQHLTPRIPPSPAPLYKGSPCEIAKEACLRENAGDHEHSHLGQVDRSVLHVSMGELQHYAVLQSGHLPCMETPCSPPEPSHATYGAAQCSSRFIREHYSQCSSQFIRGHYSQCSQGSVTLSGFG